MRLSLTEDVAFLKGFPFKPEMNKIVINCLKSKAENKSRKMEDYSEEISKYNLI